MIVRDHVTILVLVMLAASVFGLAHYNSAYTEECGRSARLQREVVSLRMRNDLIKAALGTAQLDAINATQATERVSGRYRECELSLAESSGRLAITRERLLMLEAQKKETRRPSPAAAPETQEDMKLWRECAGVKQELRRVSARLNRTKEMCVLEINMLESRLNSCRASTTMAS